MNNTWIDRLFARIEAQFPGRFYSQFPADQDGVNRKLALARNEWAAAIKRRCEDKELLGKALSVAVDMLPECCKYAPALGDVIGCLDDAIQQLRPRKKLEMYEDGIAKLRGGNIGAGLLEHFGPHAKSDVAKAKLEKMRRILAGEPVEAVTGISMEEHKRRAGL